MTVRAEFIRPYRLRARLLLGGALGTLALAAPGTAHGQAFNATPNVPVGNVSFNDGSGTSTITINSNSAIIDWSPTGGTFLPAGNVATFQNGPGLTNFAVLNRVQSTLPTQFAGTVNGRIVIPGRVRSTSIWLRPAWRSPALPLVRTSAIMASDR